MKTKHSFYCSFPLLLVIFCLSLTPVHAQDWLPDPVLRQTIQEFLGLPANTPLTKDHMQQLQHLGGNHKGISDITGLEFATNLKELHLGGNKNNITDIRPLANLLNLKSLHIWRTPSKRHASVIVLDIRPLANLINLEVLSLEGNGLSDISVLANLKKLHKLALTHNNIVDFSPLAGLTQLRTLWIKNNWGTDLSPLAGLNITDFRYDEVCDFTWEGESVITRIENRTFPSIAALWPKGSIEEMTRFDFHHGTNFGLWWNSTETEPTHGLAIRLSGDIAQSKEYRQQMLRQNPNMVFFVGVPLNNYKPSNAATAFPAGADSDFWLRDRQGNIIQNANDAWLVNILNPALQDVQIERIVGFARCGIFDGALLEGFTHHGLGSAGGQFYPAVTDVPLTEEAIIEAYIRILSEVRARVPEDFLIVVNATRDKIPHYAEYINGNVMEPGWDYSYKGLAKIESTLLWSEEHFREPQLNWAQGFLITSEPPESPGNRQRMRLFTTMGLTHSDGYINVHYHSASWQQWGDFAANYWYDFYDADLGKPIGETARHCDDCEGLFVREFTNGWAVYNRSGKAQTIQLPAQATGVASGIANTEHIVPDLDGEMYLKQAPSMNSVGIVTVLEAVTGDPQGPASAWMPDAALRAVVRKEMGLPTNIPLEKFHMLQLIHVDGNNKGITDLTGLEFATNLRILHVGGNKNQITDLRPLANLTILEHLYIWRKPPNTRLVALDIRPLAKLTNLWALSLAGNGITDITLLADMKKLDKLILIDNRIEDFSPLAGLTNLSILNIRNNPGTDFSPLAALTITEFYLDADVNADGFVNVLDLVAVVNAFGKTEPDLNGDGVVNILDLVVVAKAFSDLQ